MTELTSGSLSLVFPLKSTSSGSVFDTFVDGDTVGVAVGLGLGLDEELLVLDAGVICGVPSLENSFGVGVGVGVGDELGSGVGAGDLVGIR